MVAATVVVATMVVATVVVAMVHDSGGGGGGGVGGDGVEVLLRPCGKAPKGTGVSGVAEAASAGR